MACFCIYEKKKTNNNKKTNEIRENLVLLDELKLCFDFDLIGSFR